MDIERRYLPIKNLRITKSDDGKMIIEGYPIVYDQYTEIYPAFEGLSGVLEVIRPGASTNALKKKNTIVLWNHETGKPMARFKNKTLKAKEDEQGVFIRADVSKTVWGRDGYEAIENGTVDKMSFAFLMTALGERWYRITKDGQEYDVREILEFDTLYDFSPVTFPAYEQTDVQARSKELALRNRPDPESSESGKISPEFLEVLKESKENIQRMRGEL